MKQRITIQGLAVAVIILFIGLAIQPAVATVEPKEIDIEPKDYLFQTIIDIANNPEVKELLERYDNDLFSMDIDKSVYRKLLLRNPRLMFNILFSKPSMSVEYLNKCYKKGIEITNILGEDKVLEIIENVEVTDTRLFDEINDIISIDEELSGRLATLNDMDNKFNSIAVSSYPFICSVTKILTGFTLLIMLFTIETSGMFDILIHLIETPLLKLIFFLIGLPFSIAGISTAILFVVLFGILEKFDCIEMYPEL